MSYDFLIVGGGIIGLTIAYELLNKYKNARIALIEKEADVAYHASGRNSGVLHAGFYYTENSLKARFTRDGNLEMKQFCEQHNLPINRCGKLIVAMNSEELKGLEELKRRGDKNGVELHWKTSEEVKLIDPQAYTYQRALFSPNTASVDPLLVCQTLKKILSERGVTFLFKTAFIGIKEIGVMKTSIGEIKCSYFINCAGLYADEIAHRFRFGIDYTIIPFKGIYFKYKANKKDVVTNIYPVPNLKNPFLGVHFTKTVDGTIKIGPTAIPAFWRENYQGFSRFRWREFLTIIYYESKLFLHNSFNFRSLAIEEMKKYRKSYLVSLATRMAPQVDQDEFEYYPKPGIRAQLLNKKSLELVQDFVVEGDQFSLHVLNAVSPAFTCSFPFARYVIEQLEHHRAK